VVQGAYRDLFTVIATSAATLTGLLFVAMLVAESHGKTHPPVVREFRAAASLLAFINAFAVSLFGLVPRQNIGVPAAILGVIGIFFTAAGMRATLALPAPEQRRRAQFVLIAMLLVTFGFELAFGIALLANAHRTWAVSDIGNVLIASVLIGIARAWELVGNWDTGVLSSIALLTGRPVDVPRDRAQERPVEVEHLP
jgi:NADH:ubiquinone oxidoreductase subunit 3 (subunit A)